MISLALAILCSTSVALILKANDSRGGHPLPLLAGNYLVASLLGGFYLIGSAGRTFSVETLFFGAALALGFTFTFLIFTKAVGAAGASLATVSSRLSLAIPVLMSVVLFRELPNTNQLAGLVLTGVTLLFFFLSTRATTEIHLRNAAYALLLILLVGIGVNDFALKLFQEWRPSTEKPFFLLCVFGFSLIYTLLLMWWKGIAFDRSTTVRGLILGVPNILNSFFLLSALASLDAIFVYPAINIGVILLTTLGAAVLWKERLDTWGVLALVTGTLAIVLTGLAS